jgi:hypothetical protein
VETFVSGVSSGRRWMFHRMWLFILQNHKVPANNIHKLYKSDKENKGRIRHRSGPT